MEEQERGVAGEDELTRRIIGRAIKVHRALGPGLLESAYQACLAHELRKQGMRVDREVVVPVVYDGVEVECGYRIDLLVEQEVVVEIKCVEKVLPVHEAQLITYLKLARKTRGLVINFNVAVLKNGIVRRVLEFRSST
jgi:GxxExxY protein